MRSSPSFSSLFYKDGKAIPTEQARLNNKHESRSQNRTYNRQTTNDSKDIWIVCTWVRKVLFQVVI